MTQIVTFGHGSGSDVCDDRILSDPPSTQSDADFGEDAGWTRDRERVLRMCTRAGRFTNLQSVHQKRSRRALHLTGTFKVTVHADPHGGRWTSLNEK